MINTITELFKDYQVKCSACGASRRLVDVIVVTTPPDYDQEYFCCLRHLVDYYTGRVSGGVINTKNLDIFE